jgi:hypothetical protein
MKLSFFCDDANIKTSGSDTRQESYFVSVEVNSQSELFRIVRDIRMQDEPFFNQIIQDIKTMKDDLYSDHLDIYKKYTSGRVFHD